MRKSIITVLLCLTSLAIGAQEKTLSLTDLQIRDPYILADKASSTYYLYRAHNAKNADGKETGGIEVYSSKDLKQWHGPKQVLTLPSDNWSTGVIWAPEVHKYKGKYYAFATVNSDVKWKNNVEGWAEYKWRGTQIFRADTPTGPFLPLTKHQQTPFDEMALDGTLWVEDGTPYMVYCHEWVQVCDGTINLVRMSPDLSHTVGNPQMLFNATAAPWATGVATEVADMPRAVVTDGCFLYRTCTGKLLMIWSSFHDKDYATGIAESTTGKVAGPWRQQTEPLYTSDGGHGMLFHTFDGKLCIVLHSPNSGNERAHIFRVNDLGNTLTLGQEVK